MTVPSLAATKYLDSAAQLAAAAAASPTLVPCAGGVTTTAVNGSPSASLSLARTPGTEMRSAVSSLTV